MQKIHLTSCVRIDVERRITSNIRICSTKKSAVIPSMIFVKVLYSTLLCLYPTYNTHHITSTHLQETTTTNQRQHEQRFAKVSIRNKKVPKTAIKVAQNSKSSDYRVKRY